MAQVTLFSQCFNTVYETWAYNETYISFYRSIIIATSRFCSLPSTP